MPPLMEPRGEVVPVGSKDLGTSADGGPEEQQAPGPRSHDLAAAVGENLRKLRVRRGLSLERFSRASGVSRAMLSQIELGKSTPSISVLWKISNALAVPFSALMGSRTPQGLSVLRAAQAKQLTSAGSCSWLP